MHVALLANSAWLEEERAMLRQLVVGLVDEQVKVTRVLPAVMPRGETGVAGSADAGDSPLLGARLTWVESRVGVINHRRVVGLADRLDTSGVGLVHVLDAKLWQPAAVLGDQLDVPVLFQANAMTDVAAAGRLARQVQPTRCAFIAATEPIGAALREQIQNVLPVHTIPPGVHSRAEPEEARAEDEVPCLAISGNGKMDGAYESLLLAMRDVVAEQPTMQFFFEGQGSDQRQVWRAVRRLGLLSNTTFLPKALGRREVLLLADALVQPQALGRARSMTLLAMAHGMPVLAAADDALDYLLAEQTAWLLDGPDNHMWYEALTRLVNQPSHALGLGESARRWVHEHRLASDQIERVLGLYRNVTGEPIPWPG